MSGELVNIFETTIFAKQFRQFDEDRASDNILDMMLVPPPLDLGRDYSFRDSRTSIRIRTRDLHRFRYHPLEISGFTLSFAERVQ